MSLVNQVLHDLKARGVRTDRFFEPGALKSKIEVPHIVAVFAYASIFLVVGMIFKVMFFNEKMANIKILERNQAPTHAAVQSNWLDANSDNKEVQESQKYMRPEPKLLAMTGGDIQEYLSLNTDTPLTDVLEVESPTTDWRGPATKAAARQAFQTTAPVLAKAAKGMEAPDFEEMMAEIEAAPESALLTAERFYKAHPDNLLVREKLTNLYIEANYHTKAIPLVEANLKLSPLNDRFINQKVSLLIHNEGLEPAVDFLQSLNVPISSHPQVHALKATLFQQTGRHAMALDTLWQLIAKYPNDPRYWFGVGESLEAHGKLDSAKDSYLKAAELAVSDTLKEQVLEKVSQIDAVS